MKCYEESSSRDQDLIGEEANYSTPTTSGLCANYDNNLHGKVKNDCVLTEAHPQRCLSSCLAKYDVSLPANLRDMGSVLNSTVVDA